MTCFLLFFSLIQASNLSAADLLVQSNSQVAKVINLNTTKAKDPSLIRFLEETKTKAFVYPPGTTELSDNLTSFVSNLLLPNDGLNDIYFIVSQETTPNSSIAILENGKKVITLSSGFINYFKTDSEMALVLGHELEHLHSTLRDMNAKPQRYIKMEGLSSKIDNNRVAEFEVDSMSLIRRVIKKAYSPFAGFQLFDRMHEDYGMTLSQSHPLHLSRREISGFAASLAIRGAGLESVDRMGTESSEGSLIQKFRKKIFESSEFVKNRERIIANIIADPKTDVELVAKRIKSQGNAKGFKTYFALELKKNWELIVSHYGPMTPEIELRLYNQLAKSLSQKYHSITEQYFPKSYRVRSAEEFIAIHDHLFERTVSPLNNMNLEDEEYKLNSLRKELESEKLKLKNVGNDELKRRESEYIIRGINEELTNSQKKIQALKAFPIPKQDWSRNTKNGSDFRRNNIHVITMASGNANKSTSLLGLANRFSSDELSPEHKTIFKEELKKYLQSLQNPVESIQLRRQAIEDFRDLLLPRIEAGAMIRPTLVSQLLENAGPEEKNSLISLLQNHFKYIVENCASPSECLSVAQLFYKESIYGQGGTIQVPLAKLMHDNSLVLDANQKENLLLKAKNLLQSQTLEDYSFVEIQKLLSQLSIFKSSEKIKPALSPEEAHRILKAYASGLKRELSTRLTPIQIPTQEELESYLLIRDAERFRSLLGLASQSPGNPLEPVLMSSKLAENLSRLSKRKEFLKLASLSQFEGFTPTQVSDSLTRTYAKRSSLNGLHRIGELQNFFYDSENPEKFYRWANEMPDLVNWSNSRGLYLENFISDQLIRADSPFLFKEIQYGDQLIENAAQKFGAQYLSGKMSLKDIYGRIQKISALYQRPDFGNFFFKDLGQMVFNFNKLGNSPVSASLAQQVVSSLAQVADDLELLAKTKGLTLTEFLEKGGFKSIELPQSILTELSKTEWINKTSPSELARKVKALMIFSGPKIEIDQIYNEAWKKISSTEANLLDQFMDPRLIRRLQYDSNVIQLAKHQLDSRFQLKANYNENRKMNSAPGKNEVRPFISKINEQLALQFPDKSLVANEVIDYVTQSLVASPNEVSLLSVNRFNLDSLKTMPQLSKIDLIGTVEGLTSSPQERYALMEWILGLRADYPILRKYIKNAEYITDRTGLNHIPENFRQGLEVARRSFREGVNPLGQTFAMQVFLDQKKGILADELTRKNLYDLILGKYGKNSIIRTIFINYVEALPVAEQKTFLSNLLIRKSQSSGQVIALREVFEAMGPLGAKIAQFLRTLGALPPEYRAEFDQFFDNFFKPNRNRAIEYLEKTFGKNLGPIQRVGDVKGSGSLTFVLETEIKTPTFPKGKKVVFRFLKDEAQGQIKNESQVLDHLIKGLSKDGDLDVKKVSDYLLHIKNTVMTTLDPINGSELHLSQEVATSKKAAAVYDQAIDRNTGFKVEANRIDQEVLALIPSELRDKVVPYESIDFTPWNEVPAHLKEKLAGQVLKTELDALFVKGEFDPDAHPGNWLVDLQNKRLVRIDYSQLTRFSNSDGRDNFVRLIRLLANQDPSEAQIRSLSKEIPNLFQLSHPIADIESRLITILKSTKLPSSDVPHERLFFIQEELLKIYKEVGIKDGVVKLTPEIQNALGSLSRMSQFAREMAQPNLFSKLLTERMAISLPEKILIKCMELFKKI